MSRKAARTAWGPTFQVALEQLVPLDQRLVHDPIAYRMMPLMMKALVAPCRIGPLRRQVLRIANDKVPGIIGGILCRKRYIDDRLESAVKDGLSCVVNLGAGLDTSAYRMRNISSYQVYEVDLPEVIHTKRRALQRALRAVPAHVTLAAIDFAEEDLGQVLAAAGYTGSQRTFFIWEGVTQYLDQAAVHKVFRFLATAPAGSRLAFTYARLDFVEGTRLFGLDVLYRQTRVRQKLWLSGWQPEAIGPLLHSYGWQEVEQLGRAEYQERYLQPLGRQMLVMEVERMVYAEKVVTWRHAPEMTRRNGQ